MDHDECAPPRVAAALLSRCLPPGPVRETVMGDLREIYEEMVTGSATTGTPAGRSSPASVARAGRGRAARWYWNQAVLVGGRYLVSRIVRRRLYRGIAAPGGRPEGRRTQDRRPSGIGHDVRFAFRVLRRSPGFAVTSVLVLGLGIGSVSLMFSTFDTVVLQPLPFRNPDRLVWVWATSATVPQNSVSYLDFVDYRDGSDVFEALGAFAVFSRTAISTGDGAAEPLTVQYVSASLFGTLGVLPEIGRAFLPHDEETGRDAVAILSHGLWERHYGKDPSAIGSTITLNGQPADIVGVMPAGFDFPGATDVWLPLQRSAGYASGRGNNNFYIVGRLRDGVSIRQAQVQMTAVAARIADAHPDAKAGWTVSLVPLHERYFGSTRTLLLILLGLVSLVPLVAGANVASLFLARGATRRTELASRLALGASRARVIQQLLTESVVVTLGGGAVGLLLAYAGGQALRLFAPAVLPRLDGIAIDGRVVAVTMLVSLAMVPLVGMMPALRATDMEIADTLKTGGGWGATGRRSGVRSALVVTQVALSVMLMLASGLLFRSLRNLQRVDPGFRAEHVLQVHTLLPFFKYRTYAEMEQVWDAVHGRLAALPGVRMVGAIDRPPLMGVGPTSDIWAAERPPASAADMRDATRRFVTEDYFRVMGVPLVAGRGFETTDGEGAPPVTVINEAFAREFFPGENALGRTLVFDWSTPTNLKIVGISADIRETGPASSPVPTFYLPERWRPRTAMHLLVRTSGDPVASAGAVRQAIEDVDRDISIADIQTMASRLSRSTLRPRFQSALAGAFALIALVLASIGLYGVLALLVRQRSHEISVRLALGADPAGVVRLVLGHGMRLVGVGLLIGGAGGLLGSRLLRGALVGVSAADPVTYGAVSLGLTAVALVACLAPALRAARLDPAEALRAE